MRAGAEQQAADNKYQPGSETGDPPQTVTVHGLPRPSFRPLRARV
jgi:hypothetical protein